MDKLKQLIGEMNNRLIEDGVYKCYILYGTTLLMVDVVSGVEVHTYDVSNITSVDGDDLELWLEQNGKLVDVEITI